MSYNRTLTTNKSSMGILGHLQRLERRSHSNPQQIPWYPWDMSKALSDNRTRTPYKPSNEIQGILQRLERLSNPNPCQANTHRGLKGAPLCDATQACGWWKKNPNQKQSQNHNAGCSSGKEGVAAPRFLLCGEETLSEIVDRRNLVRTHRFGGTFTEPETQTPPDSPHSRCPAKCTDGLTA